MRVIRCPNCDEPLNGDDITCTSCGETVTRPDVSHSKSKDNENGHNTSSNIEQNISSAKAPDEPVINNNVSANGLNQSANGHDTSANGRDKSVPMGDSVEEVPTMAMEAIEKETVPEEVPESSSEEPTKEPPSRPPVLKAPIFFSTAEGERISRAPRATVSARKGGRTRPDRLGITIIPVDYEGSARVAVESRKNESSHLEEDEEDSEELLEDKPGSGNWHKLVSPKSNPSFAPKPASAKVIPSLTQSMPIPVPSRKRTASPKWLFWPSLILLTMLVIGGFFGVMITLGKNVLNKTNSTELSLQVTPSTVTLGSTITLHGSNFTPNGLVGLSRDTNIPVIDSIGKSIIQADSNGAFNDPVLTSSDWQTGTHIIRAEDAATHKTASFTITATGTSSPLGPAHLLLSTDILNLDSGDIATNTAKKITLTNSGSGQITWQAQASTSSTQSWLLVSPNSGTFSGGQSVQVTIVGDRSHLSVGVYTGEIKFTSDAGDATLPVTMQVTPLQVGHVAVISLFPGALSFTGVDGSNNPGPQTVNIANPGAIALDWTATAGDAASWLSISPQSGTVAKGGNQSIAVSVNTSALLPGTYNGVIQIAGQQPDQVKNSPQSVYISLTVLPPCSLTVSPGALSFGSVYLQAGPANKTVNITGTQGCSSPLTWNASVVTYNGGHWLTIDQTNGTTNASPSVGVNITGLTPGTYAGAVIFSSLLGTQTLPVTFTMAQATVPIMAATPVTLNFTGTIGQANPAAQGAVISNTGGGSLNWTIAATPTTGGAWLTASLLAGTVLPHQTVTVNISAAIITGMIAGTYNGTVTITGTDATGAVATGSPQTIPVTFTVQAACTAAVAPLALVFNASVGQATPPATQASTITATGGCTHALNWTATVAATSTWLTATPAAGAVTTAAPSLTNVGVVLTGLAAGTYTGTITVATVDSVTLLAVGTPQVITVTLNILPPCTLQAPSVAAETFNASVGTNPAAQTFTIGIAGNCTGTINLTPTVTATGGWLAVTPAVAAITTGTSTFTVTVTSAALSTGTYTGSISIAAISTAGTLTGSPKVVTVTLVVSAPPIMTVTPPSLTFNVVTGTSSQAITIANTGGGTLNWTAALGAGAPFASLSAAAGTTAGGANSPVNVIVNATGVAAGTYNTSVTITATDAATGKPAAGSPATVTVTIVVTAPAPAMTVSATALTFTGTTGGANPASQIITITNTGGGTLTWTAGAPSQTWLSVSPTTGSDTAGANTPVTFTVNITGLLAGTYTATVVITPSVGAAVTVTVTLTLA